MKTIKRYKSFLGLILCVAINLSVIMCFTVNADTNDILPASTKVFNNHTYEYYNVGTDWKNAYKICERKGGHLVTITSQEENDFVYGIIKEFSNLYCWLGASDYSSQQNWYWVNGETFSYENWDKDDNEPNNGSGNGTEDFLQMYLKNGKWNDAKYSNTTSDSKSGFICEYDGIINAELYQPQMEFFYQNSRYEVFEGQKIDWQTAKKLCEAKGGHLAIIDCEDENVEITNAINGCSLNGFWIGYTDSGTEGIWRNVKGETPKYTNWDTETSEPNNDQGVEDYAAIEKSRNGKWNDFGAFVFSSKTVGFICEYENQASNISPIKTLKSDGHTYELYECHETWREAYKFCERKGGHLVTISNKVENDLVLNLAKQSANIRLWLGATDFNREQNWYWVNGDSFKYNNWESTQPDNSGGVEHYAAMYLDGEKAGLWNDVSFDNATICGKGSFICEYEDKIDAEYYEPSKTVERDNKRYEIYDYSISAQNAKRVCEKKGGCLVTIQDEEENDFIHNIIQDSVKDEFWIGYNDLKTEGNWEWFSGQTAKFENWGNGYQSNSEGMEDYAIIWKSNGQWNDLKGFSFAYHSTGFICEYVNSENIVSANDKSMDSTITSITRKASSGKDDNGNEKMVDVQVNQAKTVFGSCPSTANELKELHKADAILPNEIDAAIQSKDANGRFEVVALYLAALKAYNPQNPEMCFDMMEELCESPTTKSLGIDSFNTLSRNRMEEILNEDYKYKYVGNAYFDGAVPTNGYTPSNPLTVVLEDNVYSSQYSEEYNTYIYKIVCYPEGTDTEKTIQVYQDRNDGKWYIFSDSWIGLMSNVTPPSQEYLEKWKQGESIEPTESTTGSEKSENHRYNIKEIVNSDKTKQVKTKTYYFYMPTEWRNEYNDYYDGNSLNSCVPGIYWWEGSYNCNDYKGNQNDGWPGYAVTETIDGNRNIFKAEVPEDVVRIIWNNLVDGGEDKTSVVYSKALQTRDIDSESYLPNEDGYNFYPQGIASFDGMIYVCNPKEIQKMSTSSDKLSYKGAWFYYYGNNEYGIYKTREEAVSQNAVYSNGEWPGDSKVLEPVEATTAVPTETFTIKTEKKANTMTVAMIPQPITVSAKELINDYVLNDVFAIFDAQGTVSYSKIDGDENITIDNVSGTLQIKKTINSGKYSVKIQITASGNDSYKAASKTLTVSIIINGNNVKSVQTISAKSITKTYGDKAFSLNAKTNGNGKLAYKSSNKKVAKVSSKGKITIKGCGKATITIKASATPKYKSAQKKITITVKPGKIKLKAKKLYKQGNKFCIKQYFVKQKNCDGYESQMSPKKTFPKVYTKPKYINKTKNYAYRSSLYSGRKLYIRIRSYKKIGKKTYYGKWSKTVVFTT